MFRQTLARSRAIRVGIVGAGFAGLRCADVLIKHGIDVTILEARDRVGGRVAQSNALGYNLDLGPNWIHASSDNPILRIAQQTNTTLHQFQDDLSLIYDLTGRRLDDDEAKEYGGILWDDGLIAEALAYSNANAGSIEPNESLAAFLKAKAEKLFSNLPDEAAAARRSRLLQCAAIWSCYIGSDHNKQSLRNFWLEETTINGESPFVAETYSKILDVVAAEAKKGANLQLNTVVKRIRHGRENDASRTSVETSKGDMEFDEVVITAPLGWLKCNQDAFEPRLEPRLASAIESISYGNLDKVYVTFPSAFWTEGGDNTAGSLQWLDPAYSDLNPHRWGQQGMNLAVLPGLSSQPTILFYVYGDCAAHIGGLLSSSTSKAQADSKLLNFMRPYYSLLPNFNAEQSECQPIAVLATAWVNDEFAGYGSYSNFQVPLKDGGEDIKVMRHGMPDSGLWLAGEHTAPFDAMGTTTGAYWSGEAVAHRIAKAYGKAASA